MRVKKFGLPMLVGALGLLAGCLSSSDDDDAGGDEPIAVPGNAAPSIGGSPPEFALIGEEFSFTPSASDADGDALTFSIENKPYWLDFDDASGSLSGMPLIGDVGTYANISISVSDGKTSSALPRFNLDVGEFGPASVTFSWLPPTENKDGTALSDLAGFKIYYGEKPERYSHHVRVDNPGLARFVVERLMPRTYYFVATAYNSRGTESRVTAEIAAVAE